MELARKSRVPLQHRAHGCSYTTFDKVLSLNRIKKKTNDDTSPGALFYYSQQTKSADEVLATIRKMGAEAHAFEADLSDVSIIPTLFDWAERLLGPVEVLVNNAAYWEAGHVRFITCGIGQQVCRTLEDRPRNITSGVFDRVFAVNTRAAALMMARVRPQAH